MQWKTEGLPDYACAESEDGAWRVCETARRADRPFYVTYRTPNGFWVTARSKGFGYYATAEGAKRAVELNNIAIAKRAGL